MDRCDSLPMQTEMGTGRLALDIVEKARKSRGKWNANACGFIGVEGSELNSETRRPANESWLISTTDAGDFQPKGSAPAGSDSTRRAESEGLYSSDPARFYTAARDVLISGSLLLLLRCRWQGKGQVRGLPRICADERGWEVQ
jgi:hypothetical protein